MAEYGYIRTSTKEQNPQRQIESLIEYGVPEENIFIDQQTGKNFNRENYQKLKSVLKDSDSVIFHELDRFGRNFEEGKKEVDWFQQHNIKLVFLDMIFLNEMFESDNLLTRVLGYMQVLIALALAQNETERRAKRQREGIAIAKKNPNKYKGRKKIYDSDNTAMNEAINLYLEGELSVKEICQNVEVTRASLYRRLKELGIEREKENDNLRGRTKKYGKNNKKMNYAIELYNKGEKNIKDICDITGVSKASLYRKIKELEQEGLSVAE